MQPQRITVVRAFNYSATCCLPAPHLELRRLDLSRGCIQNQHRTKPMAMAGPEFWCSTNQLHVCVACVTLTFEVCSV